MMNGFAVQADGGDFGAAVAALREASHKPLILIGEPDEIKAGLGKLGEGETVFIAHANADNWEAMAALAVENEAALAIQADTVDDMVALSEKVQGAGVKDVVLAPTQRGFKGTLLANTISRRMALKKNFRPLGFPIISFPGDVGDPATEDHAWQLKPLVNMPVLSCWITSTLKQFTHCWCCVRTSTPTHRNPSRYNLGFMRSTIPDPKTPF